MTEHVAPAKADDLDRLRALLLADDRVQLNARTAALEEALSAAVTKDAFAERLTAELAKALKRAERNDPKAVARAISPAVVQSIRREIVNSREDMVEALYPITGRMVRAAVRDSFSTLISDINKRLDALTSPALLKAHAKSIIFRKPASSFLIAEGRDRLVLERGLLIDRQSGTLVYAWQPDTSSQRTEESTLVSSMFAAISTFTAENYDGPDAELRTLDLNGRQVALRHSARHMLVVEHTGAMHADAAHHIDACFETIIENTDEHAALADVDLLSVPHAAQQPAAGKSNSAKYVFAALAFVMLGLLAWHVWDRVWFAGKVEMVTETVGEQAPFHAPAIEDARRDRTITVRGLVPPDFALDALGEQLANAGIRLNNLTQPVAGATDLSNTRTEISDQLATLAQGISALEESLQQQNQNFSVGFNASLGAIAEQLRDQSSDLQVEQAALGERIEGILSALTTMRSQLSDQAEVLAAQGDLADQQASSIENLNTAINRQRDALASLDKRMVEGANSSAEIFSKMSADLQTQQNAIEESQRGLDLATQQLADLSAAQARNAAGFLEALRLRFADESLPEDPALMASQIQQMAELATTHRFGLLIQGYSDQTGSDGINQRISLERANYIRSQLVEAGLPDETLNAEGLGAVADVNGVVARQVRVRVLERDR